MQATILHCDVMWFFVRYANVTTVLAMAFTYGHGEDRWIHGFCAMKCCSLILITRIFLFVFHMYCLTNFQSKENSLSPKHNWKEYQFKEIYRNLVCFTVFGIIWVSDAQNLLGIFSFLLSVTYKATLKRILALQVMRFLHVDWVLLSVPSSYTNWMWCRINAFRSFKWI